jgi:hypothetical protein
MIRGCPIHPQGVQKTALGFIVIPNSGDAVGITGGQEYTPCPFDIPLVIEDVPLAVQGDLKISIQAWFCGGFYKEIFAFEFFEYFFIIHIAHIPLGIPL